MTLALNPARRRLHTPNDRGYCRHCATHRDDTDDDEECAVRLRAALDELVARIAEPADPVVPATDEEVKRAFRGFPRGRAARLTAWRCAGRDVYIARGYAPLLRAGTPSQSAHGSAVVVRDGDGAILALVVPTWAADLSDLVPLGSVESPDAR